MAYKSNNTKQIEKHDIEKETFAEIDEYKQKFRDSRKLEKEHMLDQADTNFWTCLIFQSKKQAEEFNRLLGFQADVTFIDGLELAAKLNIELKTEVNKIPKFRKSKSFNHLTLGGS